MIRTKNLITSVHDVPVEWIFEFYLNLTRKLTGQEIKMLSAFNVEKTPSMYVYFNTNANVYKFKDYSSGKSGSAIDLVKAMFNLNFTQACFKIEEDYTKFQLTNGKYKTDQIIVSSKYRVVNFTVRQWNVHDKKYWSQFRIGTKILGFYNVRPLESFTMARDAEKIVFKGGLMYGYFKKDNTVAKIYQPLVTKKKFIKAQTYIQGSEQLILGTKYLVICSSLKDVMAFCKMGFINAEAIAPDSENTMIPEKMMLKYIDLYENICTIFDNDLAGITAMKKYEELYEIPFILLQMEKDLSDSVRDHGLDNTRLILYPLLTKALTGTAKQLDI